jgi:hypothetical protein
MEDDLWVASLTTAATPAASRMSQVARSLVDAGRGEEVGLGDGGKLMPVTRAHPVEPDNQPSALDRYVR